MKSLLIALLLVAPVEAQSAITATWTPNAETDIAGYHLIIDSTVYAVGNVTTYVVPSVAAGTHVAALTATNLAGLTSPPSVPVSFTIAAQSDPCLPPLGAHAPAIFPTSATLTTGKPGSRSFLNYQLGGPDKVVEVAVQIDGADAVIGKGTDLAAFSGMWFVQPAVGSHALGVRVLTDFGCALIRKTSLPLVVK
jgi:hypothetical protein